MPAWLLGPQGFLWQRTSGCHFRAGSGAKEDSVLSSAQPAPDAWMNISSSSRLSLLIYQLMTLMFFNYTHFLIFVFDSEKYVSLLLSKIHPLIWLWVHCLPIPSETLLHQSFICILSHLYTFFKPLLGLEIKTKSKTRKFIILPLLQSHG